MRAETLFQISSVAILAICCPRPAKAGPCSGAEGQLAQIFAQLAHRQATKAEQLLAPVAAAHPECPEILLARARIEAAQGKSAEAGNAFDSYLATVPDDARGYAYYARQLIEDGSYNRANTLSSIALDKDANQSTALAVRAELLDMKGDTQKSINLLTTASKLDPENVDIHFQLGSIYDRLKRPADAVPLFEKVTSDDPEDARAWDYLALNLEPLGELDRAEAAYKNGLAVNKPGPQFDAFLDYNYGRFLLKRNQLAESRTYLDKAVAIVPDTRAVWYERAKLDLRLKNYIQARTDAEKAASLPDPAGIIIDLQLYALLEHIYRRLGITDLADKYAELGRDTPPPVRGEHR